MTDTPKYADVKCMICGVSWEDHDAEHCPHGRHPVAEIVRLGELRCRSEREKDTLNAIGLLYARQASWWFRLFAAPWERRALRHAMGVLRMEVGR